jgi:hypothetical protein
MLFNGLEVRIEKYFSKVSVENIFQVATGQP